MDKGGVERDARGRARRATSSERARGRARRGESFERARATRARAKARSRRASGAKARRSAREGFPRRARTKRARATRDGDDDARDRGRARRAMRANVAQGGARERKRDGARDAVRGGGDGGDGGGGVRRRLRRTRGDGDDATGNAGEDGRGDALRSARAPTNRAEEYRFTDFSALTAATLVGPKEGASADASGTRVEDACATVVLVDGALDAAQSDFEGAAKAGIKISVGAADATTGKQSATRG